MKFYIKVINKRVIDFVIIIKQNCSSVSKLTGQIKEIKIFDFKKYSIEQYRWINKQ